MRVACRGPSQIKIIGGTTTSSTNISCSTSWSTSCSTSTGTCGPTQVVSSVTTSDCNGCSCRKRLCISTCNSDISIKRQNNVDFGSNSIIATVTLSDCNMRVACRGPSQIKIIGGTTTSSTNISCSTCWSTSCSTSTGTCGPTQVVSSVTINDCNGCSCQKRLCISTCNSNIQIKNNVDFGSNSITASVTLCDCNMRAACRGPSQIKIIGGTTTSCTNISCTTC